MLADGVVCPKYLFANQSNIFEAWKLKLRTTVYLYTETVIGYPKSGKILP